MPERERMTVDGIVLTPRMQRTVARLVALVFDEATGDVAYSIMPG